jgi:hypothetical protein
VKHTAEVVKLTCLAAVRTLVLAGANIAVCTAAKELKKLEDFTYNIYLGLVQNGC